MTYRPIANDLKSLVASTSTPLSASASQEPLSKKFKPNGFGRLSSNKQSSPSSDDWKFGDVLKGFRVNMKDLKKRDEYQVRFSVARNFSTKQPGSDQCVNESTDLVCRGRRGAFGRDGEDEKEESCFTTREIRRLCAFFNSISTTHSVSPLYCTSFRFGLPSPVLRTQFALVFPTSRRNIYKFLSHSVASLANGRGLLRNCVCDTLCLRYERLNT